MYRLTTSVSFAFARGLNDLAKKAYTTLGWVWGSQGLYLPYTILSRLWQHKRWKSQNSTVNWANSGEKGNVYGRAGKYEKIYIYIVDIQKDAINLFILGAGSR